MKITKAQLRQMINEELTRLVEGAEYSLKIGDAVYTVSVEGLHDVCISADGYDQLGLPLMIYDCGSLSPDGKLQGFSFPDNVLTALENEIKSSGREMRT